MEDTINVSSGVDSAYVLSVINSNGVAFSTSPFLMPLSVHRVTWLHMSIRDCMKFF